MNRIHAAAVAALCVLVLGAGTAHAIDFKVAGSFDVTMQRMQHVNFLKNSNAARNWDNFAAGQLLTISMRAIASESLSATLTVNAGTTTWGVAGVSGSRSQGGALGTKGVNLNVENAYMDWLIPNSAVTVRMGLQDIALPSTSLGSAVFDNSVAGVNVNAHINDWLSASVSWIRPYSFGNNNGSFDVNNSDYGSADFFALTLPITTTHMSVTPWFMYARIGQGVYNGFMNNIGDLSNMYPPLPGWAGNNVYGYTGFLDGMLPVLLPVTPSGQYDASNSNAWWGGIAAHFMPMDRLHLSLDGNYGSTGMEDAWKREGWYALGLVEYDFDWGKPGVYGWYASGDDSDLTNGSERLPSPSAQWGNTGLGFTGQYSISYGNAISTSPAGTWGVALQLKNFSFIENLSHRIVLAYYQGTNHTANAAYLTGRAATSGYTSLYSGGNLAGVTPFAYLTTKDSAIELTFNSTYNIYKNLQSNLEFSHIWQSFDEETWSTVSSRPQFQNAWKLAFNMEYLF